MHDAQLAGTQTTHVLSHAKAWTAQKIVRCARTLAKSVTHAAPSAARNMSDSSCTTGTAMVCTLQLMFQGY